MMFSSCGKQTKQDVVELQKDNKQTEQVDSLQTVTISEHTEILEAIVKKLDEHGVKIENMDSLNTKQTEAITKLYESDAEFKEQIDQLNKVIGKCCDANVEKTSKKEQKKVVKESTIEDENTPSDTTKTVKEGPKKDGEAFSF